MVYRNLGAGRTSVDAAHKLGKHRSLICRWKGLYDWDRRADAYDNYLSAKATEKAVESYAAMIELQINIGKMLQTKAAKAIQRMDFDNMSERSLSALIEMLNSGVKIERSARELETEKLMRQNMTINIVAREFPEGGE